MEKKFNISTYWNNRYANGGSSGAGSYGDEAKMKGSIINYWIAENHIRTITEVGSGDGANLAHYQIPISYTGYDISPIAVEHCNQITKKVKNSLKYYFTDQYDKQDFTADLMLCLDVWYHAVNDQDFEALLKNLFVDFQGKFIIIYSTDTNSQFTETGEPLSEHVRFREVQSEILKYPQWRIKYMIDGFRDVDEVNYRFPSMKKFFLLERI